MLNSVYQLFHKEDKVAFDRVYLEIFVLSSKNNPQEKHLVVNTQPFMEHDFVERDNSFQASNRFYLMSNSCLEIDGSDALYVRGDNADRDCSIVPISQAYLDSGFLAKLKVAVAEYNALLDKRYDIMQNTVQNPEQLPPACDYTYEPWEKSGKRIVRLIL
jgi:hypothetical protein